MSLIVKLVFSVLLTASLASASLDTEYSNSAFLNELKTYKLYWKIDDDKEIISFAVEVKTLGWVGFGISSGNGNMIGSDVVIGWVKGNKGYLKDRYADESYSLPAIDDKQDYDLTGAYEDNGKTVLKFSRKYDTCDKKDVKIEGGTTRVIYSYHPDDPESQEVIPQHTVRGSRSLILLNILTKKPTLPKDLKDFELRVNLTRIPNYATYYHCKPFRMPDFKGSTKHVVKISPVITSGNEGLVHHILVYGCKDDFNVSALSVEGSCLSPNMPDHIRSCAGRSTIAGWAIGGMAFNFPDHVGYPIGDDSSVKFVIMEIHYDNQKRLAGIADQSGLRFHYTSIKRQYDAGVLMIGSDVTSRMLIPPGEKKWNTIGYCAASCTRVGLQDSPLPNEGIKVFAVLLHSHLLGASMWIRHIRGEAELPELVRDNHYDFNFQEYQVLKKERQILHSDDLMQYCQYDSSKRKTLTTGGLSTQDEMCLSYLYYYPRVDLSRCTSRTDERDLFVKYYQNRTNDTKIIDWNTLEWKKEMTDDLRKAIKDTRDIRVTCLKPKSEPWHEVDRTTFIKTVIRKPLPPPKDCANQPYSSGAKISGCVMLLLIASLLKSALMV